MSRARSLERQSLADPRRVPDPPNAAFLPQVPQLISDSVADNIASASSTTQSAVALELAAVRATSMRCRRAQHADRPRGLRLSGGQRQRVATARALVHSPSWSCSTTCRARSTSRPELQLWSNLAAAGITVLAVSHRAIALDRADEVLRLDDGRLV
jgi:ABC-type multidrug transport system fused ATPase/permease subunit